MVKFGFEADCIIFNIPSFWLDMVLLKDFSFQKSYYLDTSMRAIVMETSSVLEDF